MYLFEDYHYPEGFPFSEEKAKEYIDNLEAKGITVIPCENPSLGILGITELDDEGIDSVTALGYLYGAPVVLEGVTVIKNWESFQQILSDTSLYWNVCPNPQIRSVDFLGVKKEEKEFKGRLYRVGFVVFNECRKHIPDLSLENIELLTPRKLPIVMKSIFEQPVESVPKNEIKSGDEIACPICKGKHTVTGGTDVETGKKTNRLQFFKCGDTNYVAGIGGKKVIEAEVKDFIGELDRIQKITKG